MADVDKRKDDHQKQCNTTDHHISSLIDQIYEQLSRMHEDDLELTEQLTSLYDNMCHLRQTLTNPPTSSNTDIYMMPIHIDSSTSTYYQTKPRSDSEPNILSDCQRIMTIIDNLQ